MAKKFSFSEQEQHILINNNVRENGKLINNKNKVGFTIGNNQLNNKNMNKLGHLNRFSECIQLTNQVLMINQIKFFHYRKASQISITRLLLTYGVRCKMSYALLQSSSLCVQGNYKMLSEYVQLNTVTFSAIDLAKNN